MSTLNTFCDDIRNAGSDSASESVLTGLVAIFDTNQDGQLDFTEFTNIMKSLTKVTKIEENTKEDVVVDQKIEDNKES